MPHTAPSALHARDAEPDAEGQHWARIQSAGYHRYGRLQLGMLALISTRHARTFTQRALTGTLPMTTPLHQAPAGSGKTDELRNRMPKTFIRMVLTLTDLLVAPAMLAAALMMRAVRWAGLKRLPLSRRILRAVGVFPITDHYYDPWVDASQLRRPLSAPRPLPGVHLDDDAMLDLCSRLGYAGELEDLATSRPDAFGFRFGNGTFESGDAEFWYQMLRHLKPRRLYEIGSGASTRLAIRALQRNRAENPGYQCEHVCIEPYEAAWLEDAPVQVVRKRVEHLGTGFFARLAAGDVLFIDSSHVIRPQGDVLFEYLELLPTLAPGVVVHVHDVFMPRDYLAQWLLDDGRLWNEQYLLEAFLTDNDRWQVIAALNYLHHAYPEALRRTCPYITPDREPASLYLRRLR